MLKKLLFLSIFVLTVGTANAANYYASNSGGAAASCVDNTTNICTMQRALVVSGTGTNNIIASAGTYDVGSTLTIDSANTGGNITIQSASGTNDVTLASTGGVAVITISANAKSGSLTLDHINLVDTDATRLIRNSAPEFSVTWKNATGTNTEATKGYDIEYAEDTTNRIAQTTSTGVYTGLRTGATTNVSIAQQITVGGSALVTNRIALYLKRFGTGWDYRNGDTLTVTIETNNAGAPSGTPITNGTSTTRLAYDISPVGQWEYFDLPVNATPSASTVYWVRLSGSYTPSATNYIGWEVNTSGAYASGDSSIYNGTTWTASAANTDYSFSINRNHTRDLTLQNLTLTSIKELMVVDWVRNVMVDGVTWNRSGSASSNVFTVSATESGYPVNNFEIKNGSYDGSTANSASIFWDNTHDNEVGWTNKLAIYNNTINHAGKFLELKKYVKKLLVKKNTMTLSYNGNTPFNLGYEVDGVDPQEYSNYPFEQIAIENNSFTYTSSTHNHLFRPGVGADGGIFRNNTIIANGAIGSSGNWGIILKASGWFIEGNKFYGPGPGIYVCTNNNRITYNTIETTGSEAGILFYPHQDVIYGGITGLPKLNYVADNVFLSHSSQPAVKICDTPGCAASGASTLGLGRTSEYWSNIIDNNIYYSLDSTWMYNFNAGTASSLVTAAQGIDTVRSTWQSSTYTDAASLSNYNDLSVYSKITNPGLSGIGGNFNCSSTDVLGKGSISVSNIGGVQDGGTCLDYPYKQTTFSGNVVIGN